jgi:c-di-GMP-binding flagellar brake protein YcgR
LTVLRGCAPAVYSRIVYPESICRINRRSSTRVAVRLACHVVWLQGGEPSAMITENISRDGMLLRWEDSGGRLPSAGEMLIVEVELPEREGFERRCIRCQTTVARVHVDPDAAVTWVGLRIHAMEFRVAQRAPAHRELVGQKGYGSRMF